MSKRVTIILDDSILKKLRLRQAQIIKESESSASLSRVINEVLKESF